MRCDSWMCDYMLECCWTISNTFLSYISNRTICAERGGEKGYKEEGMLEQRQEYFVLIGRKTIWGLGGGWSVQTLHIREWNQDLAQFPGSQWSFPPRNLSSVGFPVVCLVKFYGRS